MTNKDLDTKFMSNVEKTESCWIWKGSKTNGGYGTFYTGKTILTHRYSYEMFNGKIPEGLQIDHLCRNRICCNPEHLEVVTPLENSRRGLSGLHGNYHNTYKTQCTNGHEFSPENTYTRPNGKRNCRVCARTRWNRWSLKCQI